MSSDSPFFDGGSCWKPGTYTSRPGPRPVLHAYSKFQRRSSFQPETCPPIPHLPNVHTFISTQTRCKPIVLQKVIYRQLGGYVTRIFRISHEPNCRPFRRMTSHRDGHKSDWSRFHFSDILLYQRPRIESAQKMY